MQNTFHGILPLLLAVLISTLCFANVSTAGETMDEAELWAGVSDEINEAPVYDDAEADKRKWSLSIGLGGGVSPDYEGSNDYEFGFGPNISATWRNTIFYRGKSLGVNIIRQKNLKAGLIAARAAKRKDDDNDKLEGLGDVDSGIEVGGFVSYRNKPWRFKAEARQEVASGHEGALVELSVGTDLPLAKPLVFVIDDRAVCGIAQQPLVFHHNSNPPTIGERVAGRDAEVDILDFGVSVVFFQT